MKSGDTDKMKKWLPAKVTADPAVSNVVQKVAHGKEKRGDSELRGLNEFLVVWEPFSKKNCLSFAGYLIQHF